MKTSITSNKWQRMRNSDLISAGVLEIGDGYRAKNNEMGETGLPFARAGNIKNGIHVLDTDVLSEESVIKAKEKVSHIDDIVLTTKGTFGRIALISKDTPKFVYSPQLCYWRVKDKSVLDPQYLYFWLQSTDFLSQAYQIKSATDMADYASLRDQRAMSITVPDVKTQKRIATILSTYDKIIYNNQQRIKLLDQMAEEIYKEWFVRLRFPGFENLQIVDGVPDGWELTKINEAFEIIGGGTPSTTENSYWDQGTINWFTPTDVTRSEGLFIDNTSMKITDAGLAGSSAKLFPAYSVLMTSRATIGAIAINTVPATTNQGFITCLPNDNFPYTYLVNWLAINKEIIDIYASGATFKEISKSVFKRLKILKPSLEIVQDFHARVDPMYKEINILLKKNKILKQTRDLLLPRLISGKLSVEHLLDDQ